MGRASRQVAQAIDAAGEPPRGVRVETMGQLPPMIEMFESLGIGLAVAVFVIFVLLTAYFQSPRLALISIGAVPGVLAGIATDPLLHQHVAQHRVVHGLDHVPGRLGVELGHARDVHRRALEEWVALGRGGHHRRERAAAADPDDRLRDDRGHGADGAGPGAGQPDAGPARPGGDRRAGDVHVRHPAGRSVDLRGRDRQEGGPVAVDLPGRPRERYYDPNVSATRQYADPHRSHADSDRPPAGRRSGFRRRARECQPYAGEH